MIKTFRCGNFRNISCDSLEFERINILIGPNNAGKSNFIKALSFAANMVNNQKDEKTSFLSELKRNGWSAVVNRRTENSEVHFMWQFELQENRSVDYTLRATVGKKREENYITEESLNGSDISQGNIRPYNYFECHKSEIGKGFFSSAGLENKRNRRICTTVNQYESVFLQMDNLFFENMELFSNVFVRDGIRKVLETMREYFRSFYSYSCTSFDIAAVRGMHDEQDDGTNLKKDGSNYVNVFLDASEKDKMFKKNYLKILSKLVSGCEDIEIRRVGGKIWMELQINGCWFPLSEVSDGTIHLLLLLIMLNLPEDRGISMLAIDEPEMNLHPAWQKLLAVEILRCKSFKQSFISTHSPEFLDEFTEDFLSGEVAVFVFDPSSRTNIRKLSREELNEDLQEWTLGDLYRIGDPVIGGWPQ